jgi:hypothetical protein
VPAAPHHPSEGHIRHDTPTSSHIRKTLIYLALSRQIQARLASGGLKG